jgi:hypothetical protein
MQGITIDEPAFFKCIDGCLVDMVGVSSEIPSISVLKHPKLLFHVQLRTRLRSAPSDGHTPFVYHNQYRLQDALAKP